MNPRSSGVAKGSKYFVEKMNSFFAPTSESKATHLDLEHTTLIRVLVKRPIQSFEENEHLMRLPENIQTNMPRRERIKLEQSSRTSYPEIYNNKRTLQSTKR
mmetsp:Transcript_23933/g.66418  ORF Transcript_23933/g.66418 Transcript_23933/m.66418 type:complete len:102 (+) Transcript_23933:1710-2015(+)